MMNRFVVNHEVPDGFLTVLEQMPGTIVWKDVSQNLPLGTIHPPDCLSRTGIITLSPIIMVQWKIGPLFIERKRSYWRYTHFPRKTHDSGRFRVVLSCLKKLTSSVTTWRTIPFSKWLVTPIYKPFRPFGRGTTPLRGLINHGY